MRRGRKLNRALSRQVAGREYKINKKSSPKIPRRNTRSVRERANSGECRAVKLFGAIRRAQPLYRVDSCSSNKCDIRQTITEAMSDNSEFALPGAYIKLQAANDNARRFINEILCIYPACTCVAHRRSSLRSRAFTLRKRVARSTRETVHHARKVITRVRESAIKLTIELTRTRPRFGKINYSRRLLG